MVKTYKQIREELETIKLNYIEIVDAFNKGASFLAVTKFHLEEEIKLLNWILEIE